jgi:hypothetical protein
MSKKNKLFAGFITIGLITIISVFAIHSVNKTLKKININEIDWDV